jgi:hypothetical protein
MGPRRESVHFSTTTTRQQEDGIPTRHEGTRRWQPAVQGDHGESLGEAT